MSNTWTPADLKRQLAHARTSGMLVMFKASAAKHGLPLSLVLAIASRETNITNESGDSGHGHGPMQLDDRSHAIPENWREDPSGIIDVCCGVLCVNLIWAGQKWPTFTEHQRQKVAAAAYNAGGGGALRGVEASDADKYTRDGDYGSDVLKRAAAFALLLGG